MKGWKVFVTIGQKPKPDKDQQNANFEIIY